MGINYRSAGVDIGAGEALAAWLKSEAATEADRWGKNLLSGIGGFAAVYRLNLEEIKKPCLVAATDGVGTKVRLAAQAQRLEGLGQDLVAMCVNDLICTGAKPLFFLDYYATSYLDLDMSKSLLGGIQVACSKVGFPLVGGETAEMPGHYAPGDFDLAGFAIGLVDEEKILRPESVQVGDRVLGLSSTGFHSNGYSLLRRLYEKDWQEHLDVLLCPTALYTDVTAQQLAFGGLKACAHITGGGIDNLARVLPDGFGIDLLPWPWADPFLEVQERSGLSYSEMLQTFNCGVGLVWIVHPEAEIKAVKTIREAGFECFSLGVVKSGEGLTY